VPGSWDNVPGIVTRLWVGCSANPGSNPGTGNKCLSSPKSPNSLLINKYRFVPWAKWLDFEAYHPTLSSAGVKNDLLYTSTPHTPSYLAQGQIFIIHVNAAA